MDIFKTVFKKHFVEEMYAKQFLKSDYGSSKNVFNVNHKRKYFYTILGGTTNQFDWQDCTMDANILYDKIFAVS